MLDGFEDLAAERDGLGDDVRLALEEREDHPAFVHLRGRTRALAESTRAVLLQRLDAGTLDYRFILFRAGKEELLLETNVMPLHEDGITYMGDPGDVRVYRVEAMPTAAMKAAFTEGVGGDADVLDGAVDLLAVKTEGRVRRCALVGCDYPLFAAWDVEPPPGKEDAARYQAISEVFDVWARILAERPEPLRLIPLDTGI